MEIIACPGCGVVYAVKSAAHCHPTCRVCGATLVKDDPDTKTRTAIITISEKK